MAADGHVVIKLSFESGEASSGIKKLTRAFEQMANEVDGAVDEVNAELDKLGDNTDTSGIEDDLEDIQAEADKTSEKLREVDRDKKKAVEPAKTGNIFGDAFNGLMDFSGGFFEGVFEGAAEGFTNIGDRIKQKFEPSLELIKHIGETLLDTFVFDLMMSALDSAKEKLGEIINADAQLSSQINTIKGNLSAAFAPLWDAVYPTVVKILNVVTAITSAIANLSAKVFGSAAVATDALKGEADAFGAVAEAAGSASHELGGFDEINTLPSSGGGGAGGGGAGAELTGGLMSDLSVSFEDLYARLMAINWETVGKRISNALTGIDFKGIGKKIAGGIKFVTGAAKAVLKTVDWQTLGGNVADGLDEVVETLPDLTSMLAEWFEAQVEFFFGAVKNFNWRGLGTSIGTSISTFFNSVDWKMVGLMLSNAMIGLGHTIIAAVKNIDKSAIEEAIVDLFKGIDWENIALMLAELVGLAIIEGLEYGPAGLAIKALNWAGVIDFDLSDWVGDNIYGTTDELDSYTNASQAATGATTWFAIAFDKLGVSSGAVAKNMTVAADSTQDVADNMDNASAGTKELGRQSLKLTGNVGKSADAFDNEAKALGAADSAMASAILSNAALVLSTERMVQTTGTGVITMDQALQNNLRGWTTYAAQLRGIMNSISSQQTQFWDSMSKGAREAAAKVRNSFTTLPTQIANAFAKAWQAVTSSLSASGTGSGSISDGLENIFDSSINQLINGLNNVFDRVERQLNETIVTLKRTQVNGTKPFAGLQMVNLPTIPRLAQGAVIPANNEFLAVLGDQKHGTNIEAPLDTIVEAMGIALQRNGGNGSPEAIASAVRAGLAGMAVTFDGERVGRVVAAQIDANRRADGKFAYDLA